MPTSIRCLRPAAAALFLAPAASGAVLTFDNVSPWHVVMNDTGSHVESGVRFTPTSGNANGHIVAGLYQPDGNPQGNQAMANNGTPNLVCANWVNLHVDAASGASFDLTSLQIGGTSNPEEAQAWMWAGAVTFVGHRANGGQDLVHTFEMSSEWELTTVTLNWTDLASVDFLPAFDEENGSGPNSYEFTLDSLVVTVHEAPVTGDFDGNGSVDGADLAALLGAWGTANATIDLTGDGVVNGADLAVLLGLWG
ncbi:MAG: hypothetical protein JNL80_18575 [Phycisphaerae bacterium]|nr:hypothetical protein [Phycisphaerae bacterium]